MVVINQDKTVLPAQRAGLVNECNAPIEVGSNPLNNGFSVISKGGKFYVQSGFLSESISLGKNRKINSIRIIENKNSGGEDLFDEELVMSTFEKKIQRASKSDSRAKVLSKLKDRSKELVDLISGARAVGNVKLEKLYRQQRSDIEFAANKLKCCGVVPLPEVQITIKDNGVYRGVSGVRLCCSNLCACCGKRKGIKRALLLREKLGDALNKGNVGIFLTLNQRHHFSYYNFDVLLETLLGNFSDLIDSQFFRKINLGLSRILEIAYASKYGYNIHLHVLLIVDKSTDLIELQKKIDEKWCSNIKDKYNRTADFSKQPGWFKVVKNTKEDVNKVSGYFASGAVRGGYDISDEVTSNKKTPIWESLPPEIYAHVFKNTRGVKWFSSSKLLKIRESDELPEDLNQKRKKKESVILLEIPREDYLKIDIGNRILIRSVVKDKSLDNKACIDRVNLIIATCLKQYTPLLFDEQKCEMNC